MPRSLNVRFEGLSPPHPDDPHPPGAGIARALEAGLRRRGLAVAPFDNWRDAGWVIGHSRGPEALDIALAGTAPQQSMLQVSAPGSPDSWIGLWTGPRRTVAPPSMNSRGQSVPRSRSSG